MKMISLKVCMCLSVENTRLGLRLSVRLFHCTDVVIFSAQNHSSTMAVKDEDYIIEQLLGLSSSKSSLSTSTSASNAMLSSTSAPNLKLKSGLDDSTRTQETTTCSVCLRRKQNVLNGWTNSDQVNREMKGYIANPYFNGAVGYRSSCNCVQAQNAKKAGITGNSVKGNVSIRLKQLKNRRNVINSLDEPRQKSFRHFDDPKRYIEEYRASKLKSLHIDTQHLVCTHKVDDSLLKSLTSLTNLLDGFSVTKPVIKVADSFEINESQTSRKLIGHSQELSINKSEDDLYKKRNSEPSKLSVMPFSKNVMRKEPEKQLRACAEGVEELRDGRARANGILMARSDERRVITIILQNHIGNHFERVKKKPIHERATAVMPRSSLVDLSYHPDIQPVCQQIPLRTTTNDERSHSGVRGGGWIGHPSSGKPKFSRSPVRTRRSIGKGYEKEKSTTEEAKIQDTEFADSFISKFGHYFQLNEPLSLGR